MNYWYHLNGDINFNPLSDNIDKSLKKLKSKRAYLTFPSPDSIDDVKEIMKASSGLANFRLKVQYDNDDTTTIQEDKFITNKKIPFNDDISEKMIHILLIVHKRMKLSILLVMKIIIFLINLKKE